ncbi:MAG: kinase-like domain-containing protein [Monoraphidium minutum]|nr:MAG: kinase-like domain-containing protein [Monoraphidium minutum]
MRPQPPEDAAGGERSSGDERGGAGRPRAQQARAAGQQESELHQSRAAAALGRLMARLKGLKHPDADAPPAAAAPPAAGRRGLFSRRGDRRGDTPPAAAGGVSFSGVSFSAVSFSPMSFSAFSLEYLGGGAGGAAGGMPERTRAVLCHGGAFAPEGAAGGYAGGRKRLMALRRGAGLEDIRERVASAAQLGQEQAKGCRIKYCFPSSDATLMYDLETDDDASCLWDELQETMAAAAAAAICAAGAGAGAPPPKPGAGAPQLPQHVRAGAGAAAAGAKLWIYVEAAPGGLQEDDDAWLLQAAAAAAPQRPGSPGEKVPLGARGSDASTARSGSGLLSAHVGAGGGAKAAAPSSSGIGSSGSSSGGRGSGGGGGPDDGGGRHCGGRGGQQRGSALGSSGASSVRPWALPETPPTSAGRARPDAPLCAAPLALPFAPALPPHGGSGGRGSGSSRSSGAEQHAAALRAQVHGCLEGLRARVEVIRPWELSFLQLVGAGAFGEVHLARWRGSEVACKCLSPAALLAGGGGGGGLQMEAVLDLMNEATILAGLRHPNIVAVFGVVLPEPFAIEGGGGGSGGGAPQVVMQGRGLGGSGSGDAPAGGAPAMLRWASAETAARSPGLVCEYLPVGSLRAAIADRPEWLASPLARVKLMLDTARGLEYLHSKRVIHFDLKSANVLIALKGRTPVAKITDFGLSKQRHSTYVSGVTSLRGTLPWIAPEILASPDTITEKSDVYSFGVLLWEMWTLSEPFKGVPAATLLGQMTLPGGARPPLPGDAGWAAAAAAGGGAGGGPAEPAPGWEALVRRCWAREPDARPGAGELVAALEVIIAQVRASMRAKQAATAAAAAAAAAAAKAKALPAAEAGAA